MSQPDIKTVLIVAGGTGGHIFPAKAVADALKHQGYQIVWLGGTIGMSRKIVGHLYHFKTIDAFQMRGKGVGAVLKMPFRLCHALWQSIKIIRAVKPCCVISFGGYVSPPGGLAAWLLRVPLFIHEQNARAGLSNRLLSHFAKCTFSAFPGAFKHKKNIEVIGNPIRQDLLVLASPQARYAEHQGPLRILVLGGSLGAQAINEVVADWYVQFGHAESVVLWHQCGVKHVEAMQARYADQLDHMTLQPFIDDMPAAMAWADVIICRAGALTVSEIAAVGVAAIFIPMPWAVDDHQRFNAKYLTDQGAGVLLEQSILSVDSLRVALSELSRPQCADIASQAYIAGQRSAVSLLLENIFKRSYR